MSQQNNIKPGLLNFTAKPYAPPAKSVSSSADGSTKKDLLLDNNNYLTSAPTSPYTPEETVKAKEILAMRLAQMKVQPAPGSPRTPPLGPATVRSPAASPSSLTKPSSVSACRF